MATAIYMPKQGMSMDEGTLVRWLKKVGDKVELNEPVMEIETDKITMEAEAPASGVILAELVEENSVVPVLQTIGWIGEPGEKIPEAEGAAAPAAPAAAEAAAPVQTGGNVTMNNGEISATPYARKLAFDGGLDLASVKGTGAHGEITGADVKATPVAARMAQANGVDLSEVKGSGFNGKIMKSDVEKAIAAPKAAAGVAHTEKRTRLSGMRKVISERMHSSTSEIPSAVLMLTADVTRLMAMRADANEGKEKADKLTVNDFVLKATAKALSETPEFRARLEGNELVTFDYVNLGCAVSVDGGLLVPVIEDADRKSITEIHDIVKDYAARAKVGKLKPDELKGSCFSVSNLGAYGIQFTSPIINQPDSGILGVGCVKDELYFKADGTVGAKKMMGLSIAFDHRINDGVPAAQFLNKIKGLLENPITMFI